MAVFHLRLGRPLWSSRRSIFRQSSRCNQPRRSGGFPCGISARCHSRGYYKGCERLERMLFPTCKIVEEKHKLKLIRSSCSQRHERETVNYDSFSVGLHLQSQGVRALHPVIMIPGVISTGLESWGTEKESIQYFRKRLWGSWSMMRALVLDKASWKRHIMLDTLTGLDPPGVKLRAAQGFGESHFSSRFFRACAAS